MPKIDSAEQTHEPVKRVHVHQLVSPMRYNRAAFQGASDGIREESLNYYLPTSILQVVKNIKDFVKYSIVKAKLNRGEYSTPEVPITAQKIDKIKPQVYLDKTMDREKTDYVYDEEGYMICEPYDTTGEWDVIHFLYRTYSLDGFADITVDGVGYRARSVMIPQWNIDLVIAKQGDHLVIGQLK